MAATTSPAPIPDNLPPASCQSWSLGVVSGSASGNFVRMFKPQFAPLVESGEKLQTVRPTPKRMPKPGDRISLRCWSGAPYRSKQRVLRQSIITEVTPIELCFIRCRLLIWIRGEKPRYLNTAEIEAFARADGFRDAAEMAHWFQTAYGLPFAGVLIVWRNGPSEPRGK